MLIWCATSSNVREKNFADQKRIFFSFFSHYRQDELFDIYPSPQQRITSMRLILSVIPFKYIVVILCRTSQWILMSFACFMKNHKVAGLHLGQHPCTGTVISQIFELDSCSVLSGELCVTSLKWNKVSLPFFHFLCLFSFASHSATSAAAYCFKHCTFCVRNVRARTRFTYHFATIQ